MGDANRDTVLVTGASSGIGLGIAARLLREGYYVAGLSRTVEASQADHDNFTALQCDLSDLEQTADTVKKFLKRAQKISGAIFCAGTGYFGKLEQLEIKRIQSLLELNLLSPIHLSKLLIPYFKRQGAGRLVYIGSEAALSGAKNGTAYCASKFGLRGFVQSLSAECRQAGLNISLINPGMVDTPFYEDAHFEPGDDPSNHIPIQAITDCVCTLFNTDANAVFDEINLSPRNRVVSFK